MTEREMWDIARRQSALECGCEAEDFTALRSLTVLSRPHPAARKYLDLPLPLNLVSYGGSVVVSCIPELRDIAEAYIARVPPEHCFETPNLWLLADALAPLGYKPCFMAEYFLPRLPLPMLPSPLPLRLLHPEDFAGFYTPEWSNALCEKRKELDVLAVGAYDGDELVALAGCSADCEDMYQIGVDVLPSYRRRGLASAVTSALAAEIVKREKVPFYCAAWSNVPSVRNALRSGFVPAWVECTAKKAEFVDEMNGEAL